MNQKINLEQVIKDSFALWKSAMKYNVLFSLLHFGLLIAFTSGILIYTGILEKFMELYPSLLKNPEIFKQRLEALVQTPEFANYTLLTTICSGLVYPLHIGLLRIFYKMERKEEIFIGDLLEGYNGINFFKYASYYICWFIIYNYISQIFVGLGLLWVMLTLLIVPFMYFKGEPMGTAFVLNFQILKRNFLGIFSCVVVASLFNLLGVFVFLVGRLFTFPFWCAMVYILSKHLGMLETKK